MKNSKKGFTLIELLVVVAIIGILASVVLASLNSARAKGADAKVKAQLSSIRGAAEIFFSTNNNYGTTASNVCNQTNADTTGLYNLLLPSNYGNGIAPTCTTDAGTNSATKWSAYHAISDTANPNFCVDSTGQSKVEPSNWTAPTSGNACP